MRSNSITSQILKNGRARIKEIEKKFDILLEMTQCTICNEKKPLSEFSEDKDRNLGYSDICQECHIRSTENVNAEQFNKLMTCKKCGGEKNKDHFYSMRGRGYYEYCIECTKKMIDERAAQGKEKKCITCNKVMPASTKYYYVGITCHDLLRRSCMGCEQSRKKERLASR